MGNTKSKDADIEKVSEPIHSSTHRYVEKMNKLQDRELELYQQLRKMTDDNKTMSDELRQKLRKITEEAEVRYVNLKNI